MSIDNFFSFLFDDFNESFNHIGHTDTLTFESVDLLLQLLNGTFSEFSAGLSLHTHMATKAIRFIHSWLSIIDAAASNKIIVKLKRKEVIY